VVIPNGVKINFEQGRLTVTGPKGELTRTIHHEMTLDISDESVAVTRPSDHKTHRSLHGTTRANIQNMVTGVSEGFTKSLEMVGVGYKAELVGRVLLLNIGFSHPIAFVPPEGVEFAVTAATAFNVSGIDKQLVGQVAAKIRAIRPPEPYKGKGIKYAGEYVRRKAGKTAKA
jgi:large subunit ribosomal protein L6